MTEVVRVGMAAIIKRDGKILMHKRKGKHASNVWAFPRGHLEFMESFEEGIRREIIEETGLEVGKISQPVAITREFYDKENKSYVTLFMVAEYLGGEAQIMEPDKCEQWKWFGKEEVPKELMKPIDNLISLGYDLFGDNK